MKVYSSLIAFIGIFSLLFMPIITDYTTSNQDYLDIVTKSFQGTEADFNELNIQGWAQISKKGLCKADLLEIYALIQLTLNLDENPTIDDRYDDFISIYQRQILDPETLVEVSLQSFESLDEESGVYLGIQFISTKQEKSREYYTLITKVFDKLKVETDIGVTFVGTYKGKISEEKQIELITQAFQAVKAKLVEGINTEELISYSGYTKSCAQYLQVDKKKINLNVAVRYHHLDNKTYIHIGAPVVYQEY